MKNLFSIMITKNINLFSTSNAQYLRNKLQNAVRFQTQNINWDFDQLNYQVTALTRGLNSLKFKENDNFLIRISNSQQAEGYVSRLGVSGINANLIVSKGKTADQIGQEIQKNKINCFIFQPTISIGNNTLIDTLNGLAPQLKTHVHGSALILKKFPNLRALVQTNFYSYPGIYKFRAIMNYASNKFSTFQNENQVQPLKIPESENPLIITDTTDPFAYKAGILNSVVNGRFIVCIQPKQVSKICSQVYNNKVDLIGTSSSAAINLNPNVRVIVQKGSSLYKEHANRIEI